MFFFIGLLQHLCSFFVIGAIQIRDDDDDDDLAIERIGLPIDVL